MVKAKQTGQVQNYENEFLKLFKELAGSRSSWQVWEDLVTVMACSISNAADRSPDRFKVREEQYGHAIKNLGGMEIPVQIFCIVVNALEENPNQDFLGKLYMDLNLGNHWHGQFFTPYHISEFMAETIISEGCKAEIADKGYLSVCDPCIGSGALLIAAANAIKKAGINYQRDVLFAGQDIDKIVAMMAYIQLSLLGCPGYITVGNSLTSMPDGYVLFPKETGQYEIWIMPMFVTDIWEKRRQMALFKELLGL